MSDSVLGVLLAAAGVWDLPAVPSVARGSVAAAISREGPLRRRGRASQRHASLLITLEARAWPDPVAGYSLIALRVCPVPWPILWFALAVVVGRFRHRLDRTGVLALRLLRLFRLCVLAIC